MTENSLEYLMMDSRRSQRDLGSDFPDIIGKSPAVLKMLELVRKVAPSDSPALILGESGTGKELIAAAIHRLSPRSHRPFVAINCSAIPEELLESQLFGHKRGSFTGANRDQVGHFEAAAGGTIFLDEIGDMSPKLQSKLLRVLQEMKFTPLGSSIEQEVDVRVIAATHVNLENAIQQGSFRLDLFYRLNVLPIHVPSLNERGEDKILLAEHYLEEANNKHPHQNPAWFDREVLQSFLNYSWPGNVRQLRNLIERLVIFSSGGRISMTDLPGDIVKVSPTEQAPQPEMMPRPVPQPEPVSMRPGSKVHYPSSFGMLPGDGINLPDFIQNLENELIVQALERTKNNKQQAAKLLGLNRTTLVERIKKRNIEIPGFKQS